MTMSADTSRSDARIDGVAEIGFVRADGRTRLTRLHQQSPLRVLFPNHHGDVPLAALTNVSGGLVGGDKQTVSVRLGPRAEAMVMAQAAEKIYRSPGPDCRVEIDLKIGAGAWLEWLPQETIVFEQARLRRQIRIDAAKDARFLAGEILVFGRRAMGETLRQGLVRDAWSVAIGGEAIWLDALHLEGDLQAVLQHPACFNGARACATAIASDGTRLDLARALIADGECEAGATTVNGLLIVRWLGRDAAAVRRGFAEFWCGYRAAEGLPGQLPRLWYI